MNEINLSIINTQEFKFKLIKWLNNYSHFAFLDSNNLAKSYPNYNDFFSYDLLAAVGYSEIIKSYFKNAFNNLSVIENSKKWWFGFIGYDCKNDIEKLNSKNTDFISFYDLYFFSPEILFILKDNHLKILSQNKSHSELFLIFEDINKIKNLHYTDTCYLYNIRQRINSEKYFKKANELLNYIYSGYIYEINFCIEFFVENFRNNPLELYNKLNKISPAPFSCLFRFNELYIISASPERFLKKMNNIIISQPMKGTIKRGKNIVEDIENKEFLKKSIKERAENIMTVDIVRNDLSRFNRSKKVEVKELCEVYTFPAVHQMISTIESVVETNSSVVELIKCVFPMASMTGAPKIKAMQLIDEFEESKRGIFSGAAGYFDPEGNFDFNVIIRSYIYNAKSKYLSFSTGSAITSLSNINEEYEECLLKAKPLITSINQTEDVKQI